MAKIVLKNTAAANVSQPSAGQSALFVDSADGVLKLRDSTGTIHIIGSGGGSGNSLLSGTTVPDNSLGANGDFYLRYTTSDLYGPKAGGVWPAPVSLIGPAGPATSFTVATATGPATSNPVVNSTLLVNVTSGAVTVNLPASHAAGNQIIVKLTTAATNSCTIDPNGAQTVDGAATLVLGVDFEWATLISNGTNWFQVG